MPELKLFHFPGACSRVTLTALEHVGCSYEDEVVHLPSGGQFKPEFRAVNPRGKIPALLIDGELLSENAAILSWLHATNPDAGLFPKAKNDWDEAQILSDLFWLSAGWHPSVRANMMPIRWTTGDPEPVKEKGRELLAEPMAHLDARFKQTPYYYGNAWSIIDTYFYWCYTTAEEGDYPLTGLDGIAAHRKKVEAHPAFQRALAREREARERSQ